MAGIPSTIYCQKIPIDLDPEHLIPKRAICALERFRKAFPGLPCYKLSTVFSVMYPHDNLSRTKAHQTTSVALMLAKIIALLDRTTVGERSLSIPSSQAPVLRRKTGSKTPSRRISNLLNLLLPRHKTIMTTQTMSPTALKAGTRMTTTRAATMRKRILGPRRRWIGTTTGRRVGDKVSLA